MALIGCGSKRSPITIALISPSPAKVSVTKSTEPSPHTQQKPTPVHIYTITPTTKPSPSYTIESTIETATILPTVTPSTSEPTYDNRLLGIWEGKVKSASCNIRTGLTFYGENDEHFEITNSCNSSILCLYWKTPNWPAVNPLSLTDETLTTRIGDNPSSFFNQFPELDFTQENPTCFTDQQGLNILCFSVIDDNHLKFTVNGPVVWVEVGILTRIGDH
jgi:hypothetical protein